MKSDTLTEHGWGKEGDQEKRTNPQNKTLPQGASQRILTG
jgi:hypothetical protein